jgi:hypothetical protein
MTDRSPGRAPAARSAWLGGALALVLAITGCKSDKDRRSAPSAAPVAIDVAAVNALVPAALKDTLVFERRDLVIERGKHKTTYTLAAPRGWAQDGKLFAHLRGDAQAGLATRFEVGANCDGECAPKPWEAIADRVNFAPRARGTVQKDDRAAGRRTMIAELDTGGARTTVVVTAWWTDGSASYHTCTATLDAPIKDAAPAFEKACQAVAIDGDD